MRTAAPIEASRGMAQPVGALRVFALGLVWLTVASGSVVLWEPAPYDILMLALIVLLPLIRLAELPPRLIFYFGVWLVISAGGIVASTTSANMQASLIHVTLTFFLALTSLLIAAFVHKHPAEHARLVMSGYLFAATFAALAAIAGNFDLVPGASDTLTLFGRARALFKDPNVYGPFLIPPLLYAMDMIIHRRLSGVLLPAVLVLTLALGLLLSFSRGAWVAAAIALASFAYLSFFTARSARRQFKFLVLGLIGAGLIVGLLALALQDRDIAALFEYRATLTLSYDIGAGGRFSGQLKALETVLENPLGIGALEFGRSIYQLDAHNVYLSLFLGHGWLGGLLYCGLILATLIIGLGHLMHDTPSRSVFIVLYASFIGFAVEGLVIDTDHWRHFYLVLGLLWGLMAERRIAAAETAAPETDPDWSPAGAPSRAPA